MKTTILTLLFSFICSISAAQDITASRPSIKKDSTNLNIAFSLNIEPLPSNAKLVVTPILEGDSTQQFLTPITLIGRNMRISMQRKGVDFPVDTIVKASKTRDYATVIPFEEWMVKTNLKLTSEITVCNKTTTETVHILLDTKTAPSRSSPKRKSDSAKILKQHKIAQFKEFEKKILEFPFVYSMKDYKQFTRNPKSLKSNRANRSGKSNNSKLYCRLGESEIDINYNTNQAALAAIKEAVQIIGAHESISYCKIAVYGTASPEGSEDYNLKLAQDRADWMVNYIGNFIDPSYVETINLGENWGDLRDLIEQSGMPYRQEVLDIIDNYSVAEGRKQKLMDLHLGIPYEYISEQFYPQLRCAHYIQIFYGKK